MPIIKSATGSRNIKTYVIATAIIRSGDKYLIAKRAAIKKFSPNQWEFISGFINTAESAEKVILRELKEELGIEGKIINSSQSFDFSDNEGRWVIVPFLVELNTLDVQMNPADHSEVRWVTADDLRDYPDLKPFLNNDGIQKLLWV